MLGDEAEPGAWVKALLLDPGGQQESCSHASDAEQVPEPTEEKVADDEKPKNDDDLELAKVDDDEKPKNDDDLQLAKVGEQLESKLSLSLDDLIRSKHEEPDRTEKNGGDHGWDKKWSAEQENGWREDKKQYGGYKLQHSRKGLQDDKMAALASELLKDSESLSFGEIDFSQNEITAEGFRSVVEICKRCTGLKILKLFKNRIGDGCAEAFGDLLKHCPQLQEVHLSHNCLSSQGVLDMAEAAVRSREADWPLWLRVEQNVKQSESSDLLSRLERKHNVCPRGTGCTQFHCSVGSKLHCPFLDNARISGRGRDRDSAAGAQSSDGWREHEGDRKRSRPREVLCRSPSRRRRRASKSPARPRLKSSSRPRRVELREVRSRSRSRHAIVRLQPAQDKPRPVSRRREELSSAPRRREEPSPAPRRREEPSPAPLRREELSPGAASRLSPAPPRLSPAPRKRDRERRRSRSAAKSKASDRREGAPAPPPRGGSRSKRRKEDRPRDGTSRSTRHRTASPPRASRKESRGKRDKSRGRRKGAAKEVRDSAHATLSSMSTQGQASRTTAPSSNDDELWKRLDRLLKK